MSEKTIKPTVILTLTVQNALNIPIVVTNFLGQILHIQSINLLAGNYYYTRKYLCNVLGSLINKYDVDTILLEQNQLFLDKIDKFPDPIVLRNVLLGFGVQNSIEDNFWEDVKYILAIPKNEWKKTVLNRKVDYAIDLYKAHILLRSDIEKSLLDEIDANNFYETICLSESVLYKKFLKKEYQLNK